MEQYTIWQCHNPNCNAQYTEYVNGCPKCSTGEPGGSHKVSILDKYHPAYKTPISPDSDALAHAPTFNELVELIEKNFRDVLEGSRAFTPEEIDKSWSRYKALNHLYQDEPAIQPPSAPAVDLEEKANQIYKELCEREGRAYHIKEAADFCLGYMAAASTTQGAAWVNASERLPEPFNVVPCKYTPDSPDPRRDTELHWGFVSKEGKWDCEWQNHQIEWLDESAPSKEDAVGFLEWATFKYVHYFDDNTQCWSWVNDGENYYTTEQLYDLFKQTNKKEQ